MSEIVAYLKDGKGFKYKVEKYSGFKTLISNTDYYRILYENGNEYAKDFSSYDASIRYLEGRKGNLRK